MGTASMYGHQEFDVELDCPWMTLDVKVTYINHGEEGLAELVSVEAYGIDITNWINIDYIYDLIADDMSNADYHWSDHGD
jgi:hypothetical protein